jgi:hypothetical protein
MPEVVVHRGRQQVVLAPDGFFVGHQCDYGLTYYTVSRSINPIDTGDFRGTAIAPLTWSEKVVPFEGRNHA